MSTVTHEVVGDPATLEGLRPEWTAALQREHGNLYATFEWVTSLWKSHFDCRGVDFHVLRDRGSLRGIVPVTKTVVHKLRVPLRFYGLLTNEYGRNHNELILFGDRTEAFLAYLDATRSEPWDVLLLGSMVSGGESSRAADAVETRGKVRVVREPYVSSPYLTLAGHWDDFLAGQSGNFRSDLKRKQKRASQAGMEIQILTRPEEVAEAVDAMNTIETKSWKQETGTAIATIAHARRFYEVFLPVAAARGWLHCMLLRLEGRPAAFDMGIIHDGKYYMLKTSYDQEWKEASPGFVLRACVIERLLQMGIREHDFLGDPDPWKLRWTSELRHHENLYLYNRGRPLANLYAVASRYLRKEPVRT